MNFHSVNNQLADKHDVRNNQLADNNDVTNTMVHEIIT